MKALKPRYLLADSNGQVVAELGDLAERLIEGVGIIEWRGVNYVYSPYHSNGEYEFFMQSGTIMHVTDAALKIRKEEKGA